jgi:hypothetical protein
MIEVAFTDHPLRIWIASMKLYVTFTSPYARLARIVVAEKALHDRVKIIEAKTRTPGSPYYLISPSGAYFPHVAHPIWCEFLLTAAA